MFRNFLKKNKSTIVFLGDVGIFILSLIVMVYIRYRLNEFTVALALHVRPFEILLAIWVCVFYATDLYSYTSWKINQQNIRKFVTAFLLNFLFSIIIFYAFGDFFKLTPKINLVLFAFLFFVFDATWRLLIAKILSSRNNNKIIAIFSSSPLSQEIIHHCDQHPQLGYSVETHSSLETIQSAIAKHKGKIIILVDNSFLKEENIAKILYELLAEHVEISTLTEFYEELLGRIPLSEIKEEWFIQEIKSNKSFFETIKRIYDILFAVCGIIIFSPLFVVFFIIIPLTSKGGAIYKQKRVGKDGKIFTIYKFRNMYSEVEKNPDYAGSAAVWWSKNDSRVTPLGKFLRKTHFDELPQLYNILAGEMSVVGPRPERPEFVIDLKNSIPHYFMRQTVNPGLTGWAQIMFRYANTADEQKEKFKYDLYYIKNRNTLLDLSIIIKTVRLIFSTK